MIKEMKMGMGVFPENPLAIAHELDIPGENHYV